MGWHLQFPSGLRKWRIGTTVLTLLNVVDRQLLQFFEVLCFLFVLVNIKFVYKCECIIK